MTVVARGLQASGPEDDVRGDAQSIPGANGRPMVNDVEANALQRIEHVDTAKPRRAQLVPQTPVHRVAHRPARGEQVARAAARRAQRLLPGQRDAAVAEILLARAV